MIKYVVDSAKKAQKNQKDFEIFGRITFKLTDNLPENVSVKSVISAIEQKLPEHILYDVDSIYVGNFQPLNDKKIDSLYVSGTILVGPNHQTNQELFSTLVHEFAHAIEETARDFIYMDGSIGREFLAKRDRLYYMLKDDYKISKKQFSFVDYDPNFDSFLNDEIGYENLGLITNGLFISPYGCTSLREYFANGFEHYYVENPKIVKEISPSVYRKIKEIVRGDYR